MSVLVLSIHIQHRHSEYWRRLQSTFVAETAGDYEYGTIVNGDDPTLYTNPAIHLPVQVSHSQAIKAALEVFKSSQHRFKYFLLLDSDCWPVRPDWLTILSQLLGDSYQYAAPIRVENFDTFPHPCAFFMKSEFLSRADFGFERAANLLGRDVSDVGAAMPQRDTTGQLWYPLIKTNYISPHPLYASIYADLFYHHCAGSRGLGFRANGFNFYDHVLDRRDHRQIYNRTTVQLIQQPRRFIDNLRGVDLRVVNKAGVQ